jgi:tetratricopeptide (TPR) repeat protein
MAMTMRFSVALCLVFLPCCSRPGEPAPKLVEGPVAGSASAEAAPPAKVPEPSPRDRKEAERRTWAYQLTALDTRIASAKEIAEKNKSSFMALDRVAGMYLERARMTGDYGDYAQAETFIAKAFEVDEKGFGPFMSRARLNYTLHRMDRVDADFEKAQQTLIQDDEKRAGLLLFAGNIALQRGRYADALAAYEESTEIKRNAANLPALAFYRWGTADFDAADALYLEALEQYHGKTFEPIAWMHLQRGLMDLSRGRYDDALAHYREAETWLRGHWLIDEHIAEILTLTGKTDEAIALYLEIIERTNNPEFMDAMAGILGEQGKPDEAREYVTRARKRYEELMARYPEAAYGHALGHYLEFGDDATFVVDLAEKNHTLRPNVDAKVLLAQAYTKAERTADAKRVIDEALATVWNTADLHATAAKVYRATGDATRADEELAKAKAIDPHAEE